MTAISACFLAHQLQVMSRHRIHSLEINVQITNRLLIILANVFCYGIASWHVYMTVQSLRYSFMKVYVEVVMVVSDSISLCMQP